MDFSRIVYRLMFTDGQKSLFCMALCSVVISASAQQQKGDWSFFLYGKTHSFYNQGVYELGKTNNAKANGLGISFSKPIAKRLSFFGGYDFALADGLPYPLGSTTKANYHQLDANVALDAFRLWRIQSYVFTGYGWNSIPDLAQLDQNKSGMNINFGTGAKLKLTEAISLGYQMNYRFSISDNIPFNFRYQFGVHLTPKQFHFCNKSNLKSHLEADLFAFRLDSFNSVNDSLLNVIILANTTKVEYMRTQEIKALEEHIYFLEEDNQRLLEEVQSKINFQDSDFSTFSFIDSTGKILSLVSGKLTSGYYLYVPDISNVALALKYKKVLDKSTDKTYILFKNGSFGILAYVGEICTVADEVYQDNRILGVKLLFVKL
jgi:hypothetical protein